MSILTFFSGTAALSADAEPTGTFSSFSGPRGCYDGGALKAVKIRTLRRVVVASDAEYLKEGGSSYRSKHASSCFGVKYNNLGRGSGGHPISCRI